MKEHYLTIPGHLYRSTLDKILKRTPTKVCTGGMYFYDDPKKLQAAYLANGNGNEFILKCPGSCRSKISFTIDGYIE